MGKIQKTGLQMAWKLEAQSNEIIFPEQIIGVSSKISFSPCRQLEHKACILGLGLHEAFCLNA